MTNIQYFLFSQIWDNQNKNINNLNPGYLSDIAFSFPRIN